MLRAIFIALLLFATPAMAFDTHKLGQGGSLALDSLAPLINRVPRLKREIDRVLGEKHELMDKTICTGRRFSGAWQELGGLRVAPYDCDFDGKWLHIDAKVRVIARDGREITRIGPAAMRDAVDVKEGRLRWQWSDKPPADWFK